MNKLTPLKSRRNGHSEPFTQSSAVPGTAFVRSQSGSRVERPTAEQRANENFSVIPIRGYDR